MMRSDQKVLFYLFIFLESCMLFVSISFIATYWMKGNDEVNSRIGPSQVVFAARLRKGVTVTNEINELAMSMDRHNWRKNLKMGYSFLQTNFHKVKVPGNVKLAFSELIYQSQMLLDGPCGDETRADLVWSMFTTNAHCETVARFGNYGEGGKVMCGFEYFKKDECLVYSFGSSGDVSFDRDCEELLGCTVHAFDCTTAISSYYKDNPNFHKLCIGPCHKDYDKNDETKWYLRNPNEQCSSLPTIMKNLGHHKIDILKLDVELSEHYILKYLFNLDPLFFQKSGIMLILIEIHTIPLDKDSCQARKEIKRVIEIMHDMGYFMYSLESNYRCPSCHEVGFISKEYYLD